MKNKTSLKVKNKKSKSVTNDDQERTLANRSAGDDLPAKRDLVWP
jgi:hypothetical protein